MSEINEKQAFEMFVHGGKKFMDAARQLAKMEKTHSWDKVAKNMERLLVDSRKLFTMKAQTRMETLVLTNAVEADSHLTQH